MAEALTTLLMKAVRLGSKLLPAEARASLASEYLDSIPPPMCVRTMTSRLGCLPSGALSAVVLEALKRSSVPELLDLKANLDLRERLDYDGGEIYLTMSSPSEYPRRLACQKEPWTVKWIEECVKPSDVLYDIGANVGAYSLIAARRTRGQAKILAFEPAFPNFPQLCRNIILNGCQDSIIPLPVALGERSRVEYFNYAHLESGSALHTVGEPLDYKGEPFHPAYRQPMLTYAMDKLIDEFGLPVPNHLKIDVDGTEMDVLRGGSTTVGHPAMSTMMVEICDLRVSTGEITGFLAAKGWRLKERHDRLDAAGRGLNVSYLQFVKEA